LKTRGGPTVLFWSLIISPKRRSALSLISIASASIDRFLPAVHRQQWPQGPRAVREIFVYSRGAQGGFFINPPGRYMSARANCESGAATLFAGCIRDFKIRGKMCVSVNLRSDLN